MKTKFTIDNMMCANCVATIEGNLSKIKGIKQVNCNLVNQECAVSYDENIITKQNIVKAISNIGYHVKTQYENINLLIETLNCATCVATVENGLQHLAGVIEADANLVNSSVAIKYDASIVDLAAIKETINQLGYQVRDNYLYRSYRIDKTTAETETDYQDVKDYLKKLSSIRDVSVKDHVLSFRSDETRSDIVKIKSDIRNMHYHLETLHHQEEDIESLNIKRFRRNFFLALIVTIILDTLSMSAMFTDKIVLVIGLQNSALIQLILCAIVLVIGRNFFRDGFKALFKGHPNMDTLVALGSGVGFVFSCYALIKYWSLMALPHHLYFESSATIITFILLGKFLESISKRNASQSLVSLYEIIPDQVLIFKDKQELLIDSEDLKSGDIVIVKQGSVLASDGIITEGKAELDEAIVTGESLAITKGVGAEVIMGSTNINGYLKYRVTNLGAESTVGKIAQLVKEAQSSKAPIARLADTISKYFVVVIIILALLAGCYWAFGAHKNSDFVLNIVATTLIIACPCALGLATPTAMLVSSGRASKMGIIIKDMEVLELANKVKLVAFDKTGTITENKLAVEDVNVIAAANEGLYLSLAKALEAKSEHLISQAITNYLSGSAAINVEDVEIMIGKGLKAKYQGATILIGSEQLIRDYNITIPDQCLKKDKAYPKTHICIYMSYNNELQLQFFISDQIRADASNCIKHLKELKKSVAILSGDKQRNVQDIAKELGISQAFGNLLPVDKVKIIQDLKKKYHLVMMVGDGINDAPALASADVSVAIASGADVATANANVILLDLNHDQNHDKNYHLSDIVTLMRLSRQTIINIKQNLFWALAYNVVMIPIAMGVLYNINGLLINPMFGAVAMSLSSLTVLANALRLRKINIEVK